MDKMLTRTLEEVKRRPMRLSYSHSYLPLIYLSHRHSCLLLRCVPVCLSYTHSVQNCRELWHTFYDHLFMWMCAHIIHLSARVIDFTALSLLPLYAEWYNLRISSGTLIPSSLINVISPSCFLNHKTFSKYDIDTSLTLSIIWIYNDYVWRCLVKTSPLLPLTAILTFFSCKRFLSHNLCLSLDQLSLSRNEVILGIPNFTRIDSYCPETATNHKVLRTESLWYANTSISKTLLLLLSLGQSQAYLCLSPYLARWGWIFFHLTHPIAITWWVFSPLEGSVEA